MASHKWFAQICMYLCSLCCTILIARAKFVIYLRLFGGTSQICERKPFIGFAGVSLSHHCALSSCLSNQLIAQRHRTIGLYMDWHFHEYTLFSQ